MLQGKSVVARINVLFVVDVLGTIDHVTVVAVVLVSVAIQKMRSKNSHVFGWSSADDYIAAGYGEAWWCETWNWGNQCVSLVSGVNRDIVKNDDNSDKDWQLYWHSSANMVFL